MAVQANYGWITWSRVRVLRELAHFRTEREIAETLGMSYEGVRSIVRDLKHHTGLDNVRDIGRWWMDERLNWWRWAGRQAGVSE